MEVDNEMGQVGYVTQKFSQLEMTDKNSLKNASDLSDREGNKVLSKAEPLDDMTVGHNTEEPEKEETFIYSGKASDSNSHSEHEYVISKNWIPFKFVNDDLSKFQVNRQKDEKMAMENKAKNNEKLNVRMQVDSKKKKEVAKESQVECSSRQEVTMEIEAESDKRQEAIEDLAFHDCENGMEIGSKFISSEKNKTQHWYEAPMNLQKERFEDNAKEDLHSITKGDAVHEIASKLMATTKSYEESSNKELRYKPLSSLCLDKYTANKELCISKFENCQASKNDSNESKNKQYSQEPIFNICEGVYDVSTPSEHKSSCGKVLYLLPTESEHNYERLSETSSNFSPPEHSHDVAMIGTPPEYEDGKATGKNNESSEYNMDAEHRMDSNSINLSEGEIVSSNSSFEFDEDQGDAIVFLCSECRENRASSKESHVVSKSAQGTFTDSELHVHVVVETHSEDMKPIQFGTVQESDDKFVTSEKVRIKKRDENLMCDYEHETNRDRSVGQCEDQPSRPKLVFKECEDSGRHLTAMREKAPKSGKDLVFNKYLRDNQNAENIPGNIRKETLSCTKFGFSKDSKVSVTSHNEDDFVIPTDSLADKIVRQAEFYFSDFNVLKNNFLLKHIRRNKEGYISLKLVSSFRKIKSLTKDCRVVAYSLEGSNVLELNSEKNKVRRIENIPNVRDTNFGKTVVVFNLPFKNPKTEELKDLFSKFGNIASAEIMSSKSPNYNTYHKRCRFHNQEISSSLFGVIEFQTYEDALAAIKDEESHLPKENKMKVVPLMVQRYRSDWVNLGSSSSTSVPNLQRKEKPKSKPETLKTRQAFEAEPIMRPPFAAKFYRGSYRPRYTTKPQSQVDVRGKLIAEKPFAANVEAEKANAKRQLKVSNTLNVPFHQQQRGAGKIVPPPGFQRPRFNV